MTEYLVIVALIGVAAVGTYSLLGQSIRGATAGLALEISGQSAEAGVNAARTAATTASGSAGTRRGLADYYTDNRAGAAQ